MSPRPIAEEWITHKLTKRALRGLRIIAAYTGEPQWSALERMVDAELRRIRELHQPTEQETNHDNL